MDAWIDQIQTRVRQLADLVGRQQESKGPARSEIDRRIEEARWHVVAAVQQMPVTPDPAAQPRSNVIYTPQDLAERWGISKRMVVKFAASGSLRTFRVGTLYRFTEAAVAEFERTRTQGG